MTKFYSALTIAQPTKSLGLSFLAETLCIDNPTGSPVLVRAGNPEIPTSANADYTVAANSQKNIPVQGREFGLSFADPTLLSTIVTGNLSQRASVIAYSADENVPSFGAANFQSLSLSPLTPGAVAFSSANTTAVFDLGAWGGALATLVPDPTSGQGVIQLQVSASPTSGFITLQTWAFWPNIPVLILVPRTYRYARFLLNNVSGEPIIVGTYSVRATIQEIQQISYAPSGQSLVKTVTVPNIGEQDFVFCTVGLKAVSIGLVVSVGVTGEVIFEVSDSSGGPWRLVAYREQNLQGFYNSVYRNIGQLDLFMRVRILDTDGGAGGISGTLYASMPGEPETVSMLQNIFAALGDVGQPVNANQSIYHELDNIRIADQASKVDLDNIATNTGSAAFNLGLIQTNIAASKIDLDAIKISTADIDTLSSAYLPNLGSMNSNLSTIAAADSAYLPNLATYLPNLTNLVTILSVLNTIHTDIGTTVHNDLVTVIARLTTLTGYPAASSRNVTDTITIGVAGTWTRGVLDFNNGEFLISLQATMQIAGTAVGSTQIFVALGAAGVQVLTVYTAAFPATIFNAGAPVHFGGQGPVIRYDGHRVGGIAIPANDLYLWAFCTNTTGTVLVSSVVAS